MTKQQHRGKNPLDEKLFAPQEIPKLKEAVRDLSYLYTRNYSEKSAIKIVGDHYQLRKRQRIAVQRSACSDNSLKKRKESEVDEEELFGKRIYIDGYNILITIESMLSGGVLILARDGCIRDMASIHGSYHKVQETIPALNWIGERLPYYDPAEVNWFLDKPISNSGKLAKLIREISLNLGQKWNVELVDNPDHVLISEGGIILTSDSWILDRVSCWFNFIFNSIEFHLSKFWIVDIS